MFHAITTATIEVAGATGGTLGGRYLLSDFSQVDASDDLARTGWKFGVFGYRVTGKPRWFLVLAGGVMAGQTIHVFFRLEVKSVVFPAISDVTTVASRFVGLDRGAKVVDDIFLTQQLTGLGVFVLPFPVLGLMNLFGRFGVAAQAGFGDRGAGIKGANQCRKLAVISGGLGAPVSVVANSSTPSKRISTQAVFKK